MNRPPDYVPPTPLWCWAVWVIVILALTCCAQPSDHSEHPLTTETGLFENCMNYASNALAETITACQQAAKEQFESQHEAH